VTKEDAHAKSIAVCGDEDFVLGFQLAGVKRVVATTPQTYADSLEKLVRERDVGIIITRADDVHALPARIRAHVSASVDPVVIQLGGAAGEGLRDKIRSAIGIDLMRE
jgi:V/A-type H+-transporting ATPase subunit F